MATSLEGFGIMKRILPLSLSLILLLNISAFTQDKPDPAAQVKPAATADTTAAPDEESQAEALQKATQNPVANLISVPLQNNTNFGYGPYTAIRMC
jgi:hypothetical protein